MIIDFPNFCVHETHQRTFDLKKSRKEETTPQDILRVEIKFWKQKRVRACLEDWTRGSDKKLGWNCKQVVAMLVSIPHWHHQGVLSALHPGRSSTAAGSKDQGQLSCSDSLGARSLVLPSVWSALLCCPDEVPACSPKCFIWWGVWPALPFSSFWD